MNLFCSVDVDGEFYDDDRDQDHDLAETKNESPNSLVDVDDSGLDVGSSNQK
jgi:hypothetical protein